MGNEPLGRDMCGHVLNLDHSPRATYHCVSGPFWSGLQGCNVGIDSRWRRKPWVKRVKCSAASLKMSDRPGLLTQLGTSSKES